MHKHDSNDNHHNCCNASSSKKPNTEASKHNDCKQDDHHHDHDHDHNHDHGNHAHENDEHNETADEAKFIEPTGSIAWHVEGMDCAACAATITTAISRLPGTKNVFVSLTRERLVLTLDDKQSSLNDIEKTAASLGYKLHKIDTQKSTTQFVDKKWYQTTKGKAAIISGLLLAAAYLASVIAPQFSFWFFATAAIAALIPIALRAFAALKHGSPFTIEMLMTIAAIGAIFIQATEEAAVVVFLFCVGEVLEGFAAGRARAGIKALSQLTPKTAMVEVGGTLTETPADKLSIGDIIVVRTGDRIATDGMIIDGTSQVDQSPVTGESLPIIKSKGDKVYAGSINLEATLRIHVETTASDNTIARIIALVENAQDAKAPTARFIDSFAKIYMPIIVGLAIIVAIVPSIFDGQWAQWAYRALTLLLIGCPCALVISVPAAIASALSAGTRQGILVKGGNVIESLANINCVTFDKTGTLTEGKPTVTDIVASDMSEQDLLSIAAALEIESSHPLALSILNEAKKRECETLKVDELRVLNGKGIIAKLQNKDVFIGAPRYAIEYGTIDESMEKEIAVLEAMGKTVIVIMLNKVATGIIAMRDEPRQNAAADISRLKKLGLKIIMLTGDNQRTGAAIAQELSIEAKTELLPEMKADAILELQKSYNVAMVGDGINDAPALAVANVGIAMGSGTDVALETANAAILQNRLQDITTLISLSRATMVNIRQNITIALLLKVLFLITTIFGFTGLWLAIMADTGATVLVTLNALRLLRYK